MAHHPQSSIDQTPLVLLTVVGRHNHCEWLVFLLLDLMQVATLDVVEHLRDLLVLDVAKPGGV